MTFVTAVLIASLLTSAALALPSIGRMITESNLAMKSVAASTEEGGGEGGGDTGGEEGGDTGDQLGGVTPTPGPTAAETLTPQGIVPPTSQQFRPPVPTCLPGGGSVDMPFPFPDVQVPPCPPTLPPTIFTKLPTGILTQFPTKTLPPTIFTKLPTGVLTQVPTKTLPTLACPPFCPPTTTTPPTTTPPTTTPPTTTPLTPTPTPTPVQPTPIIITNINNNQVTVSGGGFTVQNFEGAITATPDCPPQSATVLLGPSTMENGGARILAAFDPCILTDGTVILNLPDEQGIQLVAANIVAGQSTQSAIVPLQRVAPITEGQTLYSAVLSEQITGQDPATGAQVTLNGNINSLFLLNLGGQEVELTGDNSVALNAVLRG
jgi:hypothetical protein